MTNIVRCILCYSYYDFDVDPTQYEKEIVPTVGNHYHYETGYPLSNFPQTG
jgi:hypothetical protein